jgi:hypothetical protein
LKSEDSDFVCGLAALGGGNSAPSRDTGQNHNPEAFLNNFMRRVQAVLRIIYYYISYAGRTEVIHLFLVCQQRLEPALLNLWPNQPMN